MVLFPLAGFWGGTASSGWNRLSCERATEPFFQSRPVWKSAKPGLFWERNDLTVLYCPVSYREAFKPSIIESPPKRPGALLRLSAFPHVFHLGHWTKDLFPRQIRTTRSSKVHVHVFPFNSYLFERFLFLFHLHFLNVGHKVPSHVSLLSICIAALHHASCEKLFVV